MHEREFIETRRHWFTGTVPHNTNGGVNVLNLCEGREAVVESPSGVSNPSSCITPKPLLCPPLSATTPFVPMASL